MGAQFSILLFQEDIQEIQESPPVQPLAQSFANSTRIWLLSHLLKKTSVVFHLFFLATSACQMRNVPSSLFFHQERASWTGDLYAHELKTCHVALTSCFCAADGLLCCGTAASWESHLLRFQRRGTYWISIVCSEKIVLPLKYVIWHCSTTRFHDLQRGMET